MKRMFVIESADPGEEVVYFQATNDKWYWYETYNDEMKDRDEIFGPFDSKDDCLESLGKSGRGRPFERKGDRRDPPKRSYQLSKNGRGKYVSN